MTTNTIQSVIMAICTDASRCGGAIYSDSVIHIFPDKIDRNDPYKGLDILIQRIQPEVVIVSSVQKKLIDYIEKRFKVTIVDIGRRRFDGIANQNQTDDSLSDLANLIDDRVSSCQPSFKLLLVPNVWYSISRGVQKLTDSELVKSKGLQTQEDKHLFITSKVDRSTDVCALRSIGALELYVTLVYTQQAQNEHIQTQSTCNQEEIIQRSHQNQIDSNDGGNIMTIVDIRYIDPGPVLSIDKFSLEALGIFHKTTRNYYNFSSDTDELESIPSLYQILNQCNSIQGKKQLHTMMMWPLQDIHLITARHDAVEYFNLPDNNILRDNLSVQLKNITPLANIIAHINQAVGTYSEFVTLYKNLWSFVAIMDMIKETKHDLDIFDRINHLDSTPLRTVVNSIINVVDFEASKRERRIQVSIGVDSVVDQKKEIIRNLGKFCDEVAVEETAKYRDTLNKLCRVLYIPRIGFLCSIEYSSTSELMSIQTNKEFDVLLHTEQSVYFKTPRMEQLDLNAGDLACDLIDIQESVIVKLQEDLLRHSETILKLMELCGELDCLIAFSIVSSQREYIRPEFSSSDEEIQVIQAYHPLNSTKFNIVPNDIKFYNETSQRKVKVMMITGPNSCGKTTYMKATCLVVYMAHIGCFVPASYARIPIVDAILTRMHSANSISTGLSSFATDLHQINYAIRRATNRSLIAIDEFGKGTLASDGLHLLKGLIIYFCNRLQESPYVMISTHYNRLVNHLQNYSEFVLYKTFKVTRDPRNNTIIYDFQLMDGVGDLSLADKVAALAGIPQHIIERATQIRESISANLPIYAIAPRGA